MTIKDMSRSNKKLSKMLKQFLIILVRFHNNNNIRLDLTIG